MTNFTDPATLKTLSDTPGQTTPGAVNPDGAGASDKGFLDYNGHKLSQEQVLKKLQNADNFIEQLKAERAEDRKLLDETLALVKKATNAEGLLAKLNPGSTPADPAAPASTKVEVDEEAIVTRAAQRLADQAKAEKAKADQEANWAKVTAELTKRFGAKTDERVKAIVVENGMSLDEAVELAKTKPSVFLALFPKKEVPTVTIKSRGTHFSPASPQLPSMNPAAKHPNTRDRVQAYRDALAAALAQHQG